MTQKSAGTQRGAAKGIKVSKALFLDRDGVIVVDKHLLRDVCEIELVDGVGNLIEVAKSKGFRVVMVTNQSVVARGILSLEKAHVLNSKIMDELLKQNPGAIFDDVYLCPHHPKATLEKYRRNCSHRKPDCGMLISAQKKWGLDLKASYMIGDRLSDVVAGNKAGCKTIWFQSGKHAEAMIESEVEIKEQEMVADFTFDNMQAIIDFFDGDSIE